MKRAMIPGWRTPEQAKSDADGLRKQLLDPDLSETEAESIAMMVAESVNTYGDVLERMKELEEGRPYPHPECDAKRHEYKTLDRIKTNKEITTMYAGELSGAALTIASTNDNKYLGQPIDLIELTKQMKAQMDDLKASGSSRKDRLALLAIMCQHSGQAIAGIANKAHSPEAEAIMLKNSVNAFESSARIVEKLHKLDQIPSHLFVKGDNHNIAQNQQILQNTDQPTQLLEEEINANRSNASIMDSRTQKIHEQVDAQAQAVGVKHRAENSKGKG